MPENGGFLAKIPIFSGLDFNVLSDIEKLGETKKFNKDAVILFEKQSDSALIIVLKGRLRLTKMSEDGNEVTLDIVEEADYWGDTSILDGLPPTVNITAQEDSEVFIIKRDDFLNHLKKNPAISISLLSELTKKLRSCSMKMKANALKSTEGKVAAVLIELVDDLGKIKNGCLEIENPPDHQSLADMAGTSRETIARTLHSFAKKGLIEIDGQNIRVKEFEKFKELYH
jgi:CRP-like cAMP-binding protein